MKQLSCGTTQLWQFNCNTAQLWNSTAVRQLNHEIAYLWNSMATWWPGRGSPDKAGWPRRPRCYRFNQCYSSNQRYTVSDRNWKCVPPSGGEVGLYRVQFPSLVPDWSVLMHMRTPNPHNLMGPKSTVLIDQNGAALVGQLRCQWGYSRAASIGWGCLSPIDQVLILGVLL